MQWQYFTAGFDRFIFEYNEGMHHLGILANDNYITGSTFIGSSLVAVILFITFNILVLSHPKYNRHLLSVLKNIDKVVITMSILGLGGMFLYLFYIGAFVFLKIIVLLIGSLIIIFTNDRFIWFREKIDKFF